MIVIQRGAITAAVLVAARTQGKPVGDSEAPRGGVAGWQGQPSTDGTNFVPYSVITPLNASMGTGPLSDPQADVNFPYAVLSYGVSREQCEWQADSVRAAIATIKGTDVTMYTGTPNQYLRRVQQVVVQQYGTVQRVAETDPPYYGQSDVVSLWTSR
jgi:hypothetical protein